MFNCGMAKINTRGILSSNVRALMTKNGHSQGDVHRLAKMRGYTLSQSTVGRICKGEIWATLESIEALALIYGLLPWQLMVENLEVANPPVLKDKTGVEKDFYDRLGVMINKMKDEAKQ